MARKSGKRQGKRFKAVGYLSNGVKGIGSLLTMGIHGVEKGVQVGTNTLNRGLNYTQKGFIGKRRRRRSTRRRKY